ncbi:phosphonate C-P lyase system protein PhnG [Aquibacillus albus]|uniref:Alpha-D-ribose 1-methylphosphonate 5-triphosphate synthase subunit PhnG n=1 Tax=Aquibacillus albus TaxID=1168171 RepID=A0ABS2N5B9_9BACI|nr:phosphonate C-P lyase system protein PhnG [Aquibacillus albus]MBM7573303.1 alpha-D-ribose 1-methylphosphonate 5-triphosphate synthase subunit PhnG [Aquibacillus albus]
MKKARLTKILVEGNPALLTSLAIQVEATVSVQVEKQPAPGLVMVKAKDSISMNPFYMGEALVTECTVSIDGVFGMGVIMGEEAERAYQIAVVDAAFNCKLPMIEDWIPDLLQEEINIQNRQQEELISANRTKVHFDTMEDYNDKS